MRLRLRAEAGGQGWRTRLEADPPGHGGPKALKLRLVRLRFEC